MPRLSFISRGFGRFAEWEAQRVVAHPIRTGLVAGGLGLAALAPATFGYEAYQASKAWQRGEQSAHMSRLLASAQFGPMGPSQYGMASNYGNSDGMALALHYARNGAGIRNPLTAMMSARPGFGFLRAF